MNIIHKWMLLFIIPIFVVASLGFGYLDDNDSSPCDQVALQQCTCQVFSPDRFPFVTLTSLDSITSIAPKAEDSTRSPPLELS